MGLLIAAGCLLDSLPIPLLIEDDRADCGANFFKNVVIGERRAVAGSQASHSNGKADSKSDEFRTPAAAAPTTSAVIFGLHLAVKQ